MTDRAAIAATPLALPTRRPAEGPVRRALRRFVRHRGAIVGLGLLTTLILVATFGPLFYRVDPNLTSPAARFHAPGGVNLLGTDELGRDLLARLISAGGVSISVAISSALFATLAGLIVGSVAAISGGVIDSIIMRFTDVVLAVPLLIAVAVLIGVIGTGVEVVVIGIAVLSWPEPARVVRSVLLSIRERDFVLAARALGATNRRILVKHLFWYALAPLSVTGTFIVAGALLTEAALSYLGIGVKLPQSSWGNMLTEAQQLFVLRQYPWVWLPPGVLIFTMVLAVNLVGDGLRDALDPKE